MMQISHIETFPLFYRLPEPYGDANGYKTYRSCYLLRIRTQSGIEGWGECVGWLPSLEREAYDRVIPFLTGKPWTNRLSLVSVIQKWSPRLAAAVSMALTEVSAKHAGLSICDLWGGKRRREVPVYASFQSYTDRPDWIEHDCRQVEQAVEQGFDKVKVKVGGKRLKEDVEHISTLMKRLNGRAQVAIDANQSYDPATALSWNPLFQAWDNWLWFEEPLPLDPIEPYRQLRSRCAIPVAGGEQLPGPEPLWSFCGEKRWI